ncbi:MAG: aminodeoxychorismate lyase [Gammaproteobacteria bacterium]
MMLASFVNGETSSVVNAANRGLQFGDGVFETIAVREGIPCYLNRHLSRLRTGCERLGIKVVNFGIVSDDLLQLACQFPQSVIKLMITRGESLRGYVYTSVGQPVIVVRVFTAPDYPNELATSGVVVRLCTTQLSRQPLLAGIKHMNRLEQVLARNEWNDMTISEGLVLDTGNQIVEATMSNVFIVNNKNLQTPDLTQCGVAGIMRSVVMDIASAQAMDCSVQSMTLDDVCNADEVFFCNSQFGLWPVREIKGHTSFQPGHVTHQLQDAIKQAQLTDSSSEWYT